MPSLELQQVVEDAVDDAVTPELVETSSDESTTDLSSEVASPAQSDDSTTTEVDVETPTPDEFAKKFGISAQSVTGRENRIPYSRVKEMVARNEKTTTERVKKELETTFQPRIAEFETKVRDYEGRLEKVAQFENILENDPKTFLQMLSQVPAYKDFFDFVGKAAQGGQPDATSSTTATTDPSMPQPNQKLSDGTMVYDMDGLKSLMAWQAKQVEDRVTKQITQSVEQRYAPLEKDWQTQQQQAKLIPVIQKQISDARTWPMFNENEPEIIAILKADPNISLDGAYRKVVHPKLQADRDTMRTSILAELKKQPVTTSAPTAASRPNPMPSGPRNLLDIVRETAESLK